MTEKRKKDRSPSFPFISLREAVKRLQAFESTFGRHPAPAAKSGLAWGMKENSSQAFQTLAALKAFGFLKYEGSAKTRAALLTDDARKYLRAQQPAIKNEVLREAATKPAQFQKFWAIWGADRPPDEVCLDELVLNHAFTDSAARTFLGVYDESIAFAGLSSSDKVTGLADDDGEETPPHFDPKVGDLVQIEINGSFVLEKPKRVRAIREHDGTDWIFIEGTETGFPVSQVVPQKEASTDTTVLVPPVLPEELGDPTPKGHRKAVFPVSEGDVTITFPVDLSKEGLDELGQYLDIFLKKEKRNAGN